MASERARVASSWDGKSPPVGARAEARVHRGIGLLLVCAAAGFLLHCSGGSSNEAGGGDEGESGTILCVPGMSIACAGPGACAGYQVCDQAGGGFGPCDCPVSTGRDAGQPEDASTAAEGGRGDGAAASTSSDAMAQGPFCIPGLSVACAGALGCSGYQVCNALGSGFEPCVCGADAGADASPPPDASVDSTIADSEAGPANTEGGAEAADAAANGAPDSPIETADSQSEAGSVWVDAGPPCTTGNTLSGNFTIQNAIDIQTFAPYCMITGNLTINATTIGADVALPNLQRIGGLLQTTFAGKGLSLPVLSYVGNGMTVYGTYSALEAPDLSIVGGEIYVGNNGGTQTFTLPSLTSVSSITIPAGDLTVPALTQLAGIYEGTCPGSCQSCGIHAPLLGSVQTIGLGDVSNHGGAGTSIVADLPSLTTASNSITIAGTGGTLTVGMAALQTFGNLAITNATGVDAGAVNGGTLSLPATHCTGSITNGSDSIALSFPALVVVAGSIQTGSEATNATPSPSFSAPNLQTIGSNLGVNSSTMDFSSLVSVGGQISTVSVGSNIALDFPHLQSAGEILVSSSQVTEVVLPSLVTDTGNFTIQENFHLTKVQVPMLTTVSGSNGVYFANNTQLPSSCITALCTQLSQNGYTGSCADHSGTTFGGSCPY